MMAYLKGDNEKTVDAAKDLKFMGLQAVFRIRIQSSQWIRIQEDKNEPQK
jgi:hypothetical protein